MTISKETKRHGLVWTEGYGQGQHTGQARRDRAKFQLALLLRTRADTSF